MTTAPDGLQNRCKKCVKAYRIRNNDRIAANQQFKEAQFRAKVIEAYGGKCTCCGETEYAFLVFDHVNDDGAKDRRSRQAYRSHTARWAAMHGYPESLQLLCANCNMAKQFTPGGCPHQKQK